MQNKFVPINVIKKKPRPVWMTPEFNPDPSQSVFTPVSVIPLALVRQIYNR